MEPIFDSAGNQVGEMALAGAGAGLGWILLLPVGVMFLAGTCLLPVLIMTWPFILILGGLVSLIFGLVYKGKRNKALIVVGILLISAGVLGGICVGGVSLAYYLKQASIPPAPIPHP